MPTPEISERVRGRVPGELIDQRSARAYCGPAHGISWRVSSDEQPAASVSVRVGGEQLSYRLVVHSLTRRPARDLLGNYLYMPLEGAASKVD